MKQTILSSKKVYRIWRPGWQVGPRTLPCPFYLLLFYSWGNIEAPPHQCRFSRLWGHSNRLPGGVFSFIRNRKEIHEPFQHA